MVTEEMRPITEVERSTLLARLTMKSSFRHGSSLKALSSCLGAMTLIVALAVGLIALSPNPVIGGLLGGVLTITGIVCLYAIIAVIQGHFRWRSTSRRFRVAVCPLIEATLRSGVVLSKRVVATSVIEIAEFEDEGSGFVFGVGDNQSLFLKGQWVCPANEGMPWPCSDFEIVRSADQKLLIGIFCFGTKLTPVRTIETAECNDDIVWAEKEEVLPKRPEAVLTDILKSK